MPYLQHVLGDNMPQGEPKVPAHRMGNGCLNAPSRSSRLSLIALQPWFCLWLLDCQLHLQDHTTNLRGHMLARYPLLRLFVVSEILTCGATAVGPVEKRHGTAQHSTAQHSTAQHSTAQHSTAQHSTTHTWSSLDSRLTAVHSPAQF